MTSIKTSDRSGGSGHGDRSGGSGWATVERKPSKTKDDEATHPQPRSGSGNGKKNRERGKAPSVTKAPTKAPPASSSTKPKPKSSHPATSHPKPITSKTSATTPQIPVPSPKKATSEVIPSTSEAITNSDRLHNGIISVSTLSQSTSPSSSTTPTPSLTIVSAPAAPKVASWSQLFPSAPVPKGSNSTPSALSSSSSAPLSTSKTTETLPANIWTDEKKFVSLTSLRDPQLLDPRGLVNKSNTCFLNSVLQSLLACAPFLSVIRFTSRKKLPGPMPVYENFAKFFEEYEHLTSQQKMLPFSDRAPLYPSFFEELLKQFDSSSNPHPRKVGDFVPKQEDAQEFMSYLLNQMHEEMLKTSGSSSKTQSSKKVTGSSSSVHIEEGWAEVGKHNKTNSILEMEFVDTPITRIFGISLRSVVKKRGAKASVNVEPSLSLPLVIEPPSVQSLDDAIRLFIEPESIEGVTCSRTQIEVQASKQISIEKLPRILVVQLKRFSFDSQGAYKIEKYVSFPKEINLGRYLSNPQTGYLFKLFAVISHHGVTISSGHYTCDVQSTKGDWYLLDDNVIRKVPLKEVLARKAYLLFYESNR